MAIVVVVETGDEFSRCGAGIYVYRQIGQPACDCCTRIGLEGLCLALGVGVRRWSDRLGTYQADRRRGRGHRLVHVGLDSTCTQGAVIDTHLVDKALEELVPPDAIAAEAQHASGNLDGSRVRTVDYLSTVDIEPLGSA